MFYAVIDTNIKVYKELPWAQLSRGNGAGWGCILRDQLINNRLKFGPGQSSRQDDDINDLSHPKFGSCINKNKEPLPLKGDRGFNCQSNEGHIKYHLPHYSHILIFKTV